MPQDEAKKLVFVDDIEKIANVGSNIMFEPDTGLIMYKHGFMTSIVKAPVAITGGINVLNRNRAYHAIAIANKDNQFRFETKSGVSEGVLSFMVATRKETYENRLDTMIPSIINILQLSELEETPFNNAEDIKDILTIKPNYKVFKTLKGDAIVIVGEDSYKPAYVRIYVFDIKPIEKSEEKSKAEEQVKADEIKVDKSNTTETLDDKSEQEDKKKSTKDDKSNTKSNSNKKTTNSKKNTSKNKKK